MTPKNDVSVLKLGGAALWLSLLGGCNFAPHYSQPSVAAPAGFKEASDAAYEGAAPGTWQPARPQDGALKGKWWEVFDEPELDALEDRLNIDNQNIAQYFQNFMAARAQVSQENAGYFPTAAIVPAATVTRAGAVARGASGTAAPGAANGTTTATEYSLALDASWEPDLWGRVGNSVRAAQYAAQVSAADLENERLSEQADLAAFYFELRGQDGLQRLYDRTVEIDRTALGLTRALLENGIDGPEAVDEAQVTLDNAQAASIGIAVNRALYEHAIATLIGQPASAFSLPVKGLTTPVPEIPIGVPSQLLQRRPDIAAAERTLAQANALIGVNAAAYYPTLSLTGAVGVQSSSLSDLFSLPAFFWSLGASASETIFDAGLRRALVAQSSATYNADVAVYRQTVLTAFQQVEDSLSTLRLLSHQVARQQKAVAAAQRYMEIALAQYQTGLDPYLNVITAQAILLSDQQTEVALRVSEMTAAVQLIQALGGSWDAARLPAPSKVTSQQAPRQVLEVP